jgi:hypothetical protein
MFSCALILFRTSIEVPSCVPYIQRTYDMLLSQIYQMWEGEKTDDDKAFKIRG